MEPEISSQITVQEDKFANLKKVTPLSKYLAMVLFIIMPFIGGWIGYTYAPEKVVEVERVVEIEKVVVDQSEKTDSLEGVGTVKDQVLENMTMGPYVELDVSGSEESVYVIYGPYGGTVPVECEYAEEKHFAIGDAVEFKGELVKEIDGQKPLSKIISTCHKADDYIRTVDIGDTVSKDEFVGAISTILRKDDGYYLVSGGEFGIRLYTYNLPEGPMEKSVFELIKDSYRINKEYKISDNVDIELISYERGENEGNRYSVDVSVLHDVYQGEVDQFYYYGLPSDEYPFEIIILNDQVIMIRQIYVE